MQERMPSLEELRVRYDAARVQAFYATGSVPGSVPHATAGVPQTASGHVRPREVPNVDTLLEAEIPPPGPGGAAGAAGTALYCSELHEAVHAFVILHPAAAAPMHACMLRPCG